MLLTWRIQPGGWLQLLLTILEMIWDRLGMLLLDPPQTRMPLKVGLMNPGTPT